MTSFFDRLFGRKPPDEPMRDVAGLTSHLAVRAVRPTMSDRPTRSHFGGEPGLPAGVWPSHQGTPLGFLARLSLAEVHAAEPISWLPESGALLFFYDVKEQPWGYDPGDRGRWAVVHVDDLESPASATESGKSGKTSSKPFRYVEFGSIQSFPSWERDEISTLELTDPESEELMRITDAPFSGGPKHQVGGFPSPIQADEMELEAQLVSHGMYMGNDSGDKTQRAALAPGAADWRLLLQLDSDEHLDWMWGDAGTLYFWVQEQAARRGDFRDVWLVLQCY